MAEKIPEIVFCHQAEPRENAFTLLVPQDWILEGGIIRISPLTHSVQSLSANVDLCVKKDAAGTVMVRFLPSVYYFDPRRSPMGMMGTMQLGGNYQGMLIYPVLPPIQFLSQIVFSYVHSGGIPAEIEMLEQRDRPDLIKELQDTNKLTLGNGINWAAGEIRYRYSEGGQKFTEKAMGMVEDLGPLAGGMWRNHNTWVMRAPGDELAQWEPVFQAIFRSITANPAWQQQEQAAQQIASNMFMERQHAEQFRARRALEFQREMQAMSHEIVEHRRQTYAEARNDHYLFLTNQEEYVNPYTGKVDTASNQWSHRWVTEDGREFYTDNEGDNPNDDTYLHQWEWKRTPVRPRQPE